jgi:hypothetical protein
MKKVELTMKCGEKALRVAEGPQFAFRLKSDQIHASVDLAGEPDLDGSKSLPFHYARVDLRLPVTLDNTELVAFFEPARMYRVTIEPL